jgi:hypothetical protein
MSILSRLFGSRGGEGREGGGPAAPAEEHDGYRITPEPQRDGSSWRIAARIEREVDGETMTHRMIRADTLQSEEAAAAASLAKAKALIDEQGESIFRS